MVRANEPSRRRSGHAAPRWTHPGSAPGETTQRASVRQWHRASTAEWPKGPVPGAIAAQPRGVLSDKCPGASEDQRRSLQRSAGQFSHFVDQLPGLPRTQFQGICIGLGPVAIIQTCNVASLGGFPDCDKRGLVYVKIGFHIQPLRASRFLLAMVGWPLRHRM